MNSIIEATSTNSGKPVYIYAQHIERIEGDKNGSLVFFHSGSHFYVDDPINKLLEKWTVAVQSMYRR